MNIDKFHDPTIHLYTDEAEDLVMLLGRIEDWLMHSGTCTYDDICSFFNEPGNGRLAAEGLISMLAKFAHEIKYRLKETTP